MISIIIPAYNAEKIITYTIKSLLNQDYPKNKYEIIVVDDGSIDNTKQVIKNFKNVKLLEQTHKGPAAARNLGVKHAKGNIVLFTDSDCIPDKNWIKNMVEPFKNPEIVGVSGTYKTLNKESLIARFVGYEIEQRHERMKKEKHIDFIGTFSAGYRKNIFFKFGGFDTRFKTSSGEDPELSFKISKAGLKMIFQPNAFVYHRHPDTLLKLLKQKFFRGYWRIPLYIKHKEKTFRHGYTPKSLYVEIGLLGLSIILILLGSLKIIPAIYGIILLLFTIVLTFPFSLRVFKKDKKVGLLSPPIIILRNLATCLGIIFGAILLLKKKLVK
jgi:cellulose synthase/poly-beta-1,6-N-acetylglucosamine synthase-like glycosyltransferase